jgi:hypothetical protein
MTKYHKLVSIKKRNLFLTVLETGEVMATGKGLLAASSYGRRPEAERGRRGQELQTQPPVLSQSK